MQQQRTTILKCLTATLSFGTLVGCASGSSSPPGGVTQGPVAQATPTDSIKANRIWSAGIYQPGELRYTLQISSIIQASTTGDSSQRVDSTRVAGSITATFTADLTSEQILARIQPDSLSLTTGAGTSVPMLPSALSVFRIDARSGHVVSTDTKGPNDCTQDKIHTTLQGTEVLPSALLPTREMWTDTSATTMCRGGVFLSLRRIASYTRLQPQGNEQQFLRSTRVSVSGTGSQWGQRVDVSGDGDSIDTLRLGGSPTRLEQLTGTSRLKLEFHSPLKTQQFIQTTATQLLLRQRVR